MLKFQEFSKAIKSLKTVRTSTGDAFDIVSGADTLIRLSYLKDEIETAIKAIKDRLPEDFTYENGLGKIAPVTTGKYEQDTKATILQLTAKGVDWQSLVKFAKTGLDKVTKAIVEMNETKVGESVSLKVTKKDQKGIEPDFTLE